MKFTHCIIISSLSMPHSPTFFFRGIGDSSFHLFFFDEKMAPLESPNHLVAASWIPVSGSQMLRNGVRWLRFVVFLIKEFRTNYFQKINNLWLLMHCFVNLMIFHFTPKPDWQLCYSVNKPPNDISPTWISFKRRILLRASLPIGAQVGSASILSLPSRLCLEIVIIFHATKIIKGVPRGLWDTEKSLGFWHILTENRGHDIYNPHIAPLRGNPWKHPCICIVWFPQNGYFNDPWKMASKYNPKCREIQIACDWMTIFGAFLSFSTRLSCLEDLLKCVKNNTNSSHSSLLPSECRCSPNSTSCGNETAAHHSKWNRHVVVVWVGHKFKFVNNIHSNLVHFKWCLFKKSCIVMEFVSISPALRPHHFSPRVVSSGAGLEKVSLALNGFETGQASEFQKRSPLSVFLVSMGTVWLQRVKSVK